MRPNLSEKSTLASIRRGGLSSLAMHMPEGSKKDLSSSCRFPRPVLVRTACAMEFLPVVAVRARLAALPDNGLSHRRTGSPRSLHGGGGLSICRESEHTAAAGEAQLCP